MARRSGATEKEVHAGDDGTIVHAELALPSGDIVMLGSEPPGGDPRWGAHAGQGWLYVTTDDPDALYERAVAAGA